MNSRLGVYAAPQHNDNWLELLRESRPYDCIILDPDVAQISRAYQASPTTEIVLRRWEWDDGRTDQNPQGVYAKLQSDPAGLAHDHARQYGAWLAELEGQARERGLPFPPRAQIAVHLVNEPDSNYLMPQLNTYTVAAVPLFEALGVKVEGLNLATGHPAHLVDGAPDWSPVMPAIEALARGGHYLVVHEYYNDFGLTDPSLYPWHIGRYAKWGPKGFKVKIGEFGFDNVLNGREGRHQGWGGRLSAERYVGDTNWYVAQQPINVVSVRVFLTDFKDKTWESFSIADVWRMFATLAREHLVRPIPLRPQQPVTVHLPIVGNGGGDVSTPLPQGIIDPQVLEAILQIESGRRALGADGRPIIRFEAHIFKQQLGNDALFAQHFRYGSPVWTGQEMLSELGNWDPIHTGKQSTEWDAFHRAATLNYEAAAQSIGMGAPQIMGFNHASIGYPSATGMLESFHNANVQVIAFINFILSRPALHSAVRNKDWREIARIYNGAGNIDHYALLLEGAYNRIKGKA